MRELLAQEAAKIMAGEGVRDFQRAKHKACQRLGYQKLSALPSNFEIEQAITAFNNTYTPQQTLYLKKIRIHALEIMQKLKHYTPFIVGPVLDGAATLHTPISLHVYAENVETISELIQQIYGVPKFEERRYTLNSKKEYIPTLVFESDIFEVELSVFDFGQRSQKPKSKSRQRSMQRLNIKGLTNLINEMPG